LLDQWWNAFLVCIEVGFEGMEKLFTAPITDQDLINGYASKKGK
jgi:hypothetical protein